MIPDPRSDHTGPSGGAWCMVHGGAWWCMVHGGAVQCAMVHDGAVCNGACCRCSEVQV